MVIKGSARGGAMDLAKHLQRTDTNEKMELRELRGVCAENLTDALLEMEAVASGARSKRHFYHASINTRADELLTPAQEKRAIDRLEAELGLTDQARAVVAHVKEGRAHLHVVWSRIDLATMRAIPDSHNYRRHELVARDLEREFGHERVQGAHIERAGVARPERTPSHAEMQQAARTGLTPKEATALITNLWQQTDSGQALAAALADQGWVLARGDRRDFVAIDPHGEPHNLARRVDGARAKDVRERLADLDPAALPSVDEAKAQQAERQAAKAQQQARGGEDRIPPPAPTAEPAPHPFAAAQQALTGSAHLGVAAQHREAETPAAPAFEAKAKRIQDRAEVRRAATAPQGRAEEFAKNTLAKPEPAAPVAAAARGVTKAADGVANAIGSLVDFFVDGPKPLPSPAEQERLVELAADAERLAQFEADRVETQRQAINTAAADEQLSRAARRHMLLQQLEKDRRTKRDNGPEREHDHDVSR